jgi:ubiquitin C-terminal hydrolase
MAYNWKLVSNSFGLSNPDARCYYNSAIQALLACPVLYEFSKKLNIHNGNEQNISQLLTDITTKSFGHGQSSAHEAIQMIIEKYNLYDIFKIKYKIIGKCKDCKHNKYTKELSNTYAYLPRLPKEITYEEGLQLHAQSGHDCICAECKKITETIEFFKLIESSDIIMVQYPTEFVRQVYDEPLKVEINGNYYYKVAQIIHFGSLHGGHYICEAIRTVDNDLKIMQFNDNNITPLADFNQYNGKCLIFYHKK